MCHVIKVYVSVIYTVRVLRQASCVYALVLTLRRMTQGEGVSDYLACVCVL